MNLQEAIARLTECFNSLRHRKEFKNRVIGGMKSIECKLGQLHQWHVHAHMILEGTEWPGWELRGSDSRNEFATLWHKVTGDSYQVNLQLIGDQQDLSNRISYVAKYATKPVNQEVINRPDSLSEAIISLKGTRQFSFFGSWHNMQAEANDDKEEVVPLTDWSPVAPLSRLMNCARRGESWAIEVMHSIASGELMEHAPPHRLNVRANIISAAQPPPITNDLLLPF